MWWSAVNQLDWSFSHQLHFFSQVIRFCYQQQLPSKYSLKRKGGGGSHYSKFIKNHPSESTVNRTSANTCNLITFDKFPWQNSICLEVKDYENKALSVQKKVDRPNLLLFFQFNDSNWAIPTFNLSELLNPISDLPFFLGIFCLYAGILWNEVRTVMYAWES